MGILKPGLLLPVLSSLLLCNAARASEPPPRVGAVRGEVAPVKKPAPKKAPAKRRAVRQIDGDTPAAPAPAPTPARDMAIPRPMPSPVAPGPAVLNGCDGPACLDAGGGRFNGGVGTTLISPQGRLCNNNGMTVQCF